MTFILRREYLFRFFLVTWFLLDLKIIKSDKKILNNENLITIRLNTEDMHALL